MEEKPKPRVGPSEPGGGGKDSNQLRRGQYGDPARMPVSCVCVTSLGRRDSAGATEGMRGAGVVLDGRG